MESYEDKKQNYILAGRRENQSSRWRPTTSTCMAYQLFQDGGCQYSRGRCWYIDSKMATVELRVAIEKTIFKQMYSVPHCFREDSIQTFVLVSLPRLNQDGSSLLGTSKWFTRGHRAKPKHKSIPDQNQGVKTKWRLHLFVILLRSFIC